MDILVNGIASSLSSRGVGRYVASVLRELQWSGHVECLQPIGIPLLERARELGLRGRRDSILWTPCQRGPIRAHHHVVTVHDCINVEWIYRDDWRLPLYRRLFTLVMRHAVAIVAISEATRAALHRNYELDDAKVRVIRSGHDALPERDGSTRRTEDRPYVLMVTNDLPHKNAAAAVAAFARSSAVRLDVELRVVGSLPGPAQQACHAAGARLTLLADVPDEQLADLYRGCAFLLSPSLSEGHNLTVAEALAAGAEVLCSEIDAHREYYAGQVRFFDPGRVDAVVAAIDEALQRPRPWFPAAPTAARRSFADVARDYATLFRSIDVRHARHA